MDVIRLQATDLLVASCLVLLCAAISFALRLGMQRQTLWAAARTVVQLLLVGHILKLVFAHAAPWLTALVAAAMMGLAAREVAARPKARLAGHGNGWVGVAAVGATTLVTALFILNTALRPDPWYDPRYVIALVGIVLGSVLNAASLALDGMLAGASREKLAIEARISLGAPPRLAFATVLRESVRRGILPSINQMSAAGIITLPGIMTGQIIAGMDPVEAAKYQILLMFLLWGQRHGGHGRCLRRHAAVERRARAVAAGQVAHARLSACGDGRGGLRPPRLPATRPATVGHQFNENSTRAGDNAPARKCLRAAFAQAGAPRRGAPSFSGDGSAPCGIARACRFLGSRLAPGSRQITPA